MRFKNLKEDWSKAPVEPTCEDGYEFDSEKNTCVKIKATTKTNTGADVQPATGVGLGWANSIKAYGMDAEQSGDSGVADKKDVSGIAGCSVSSVRYSKTCNDNNIGPGCGGQNVKDIQQKLKSIDSSALPKFGVDCKYGRETARAIKKFQKINGLPSTGIVDQATNDKLFAVNESKILNQYNVINNRHESLEKLVFERLVKGCK